MSDDIWLHIIQVHQYSKELLIKGEEINIFLDSFLQPMKEQRDTLEHIIRARAAELGLVENVNDRYSEGNLQKALGHEYRAFFDIADWVSINIREKVIESVSSFSQDCISRVFPSYYTEIRPNLEKINIDIANIRKNKDLPKTSDVIPEVETYVDKINELLDILHTMPPYIPQLEDCKKEIANSKVKSAIFSISLVILSVILGGIIGYLIK